jgi:glutamyl-tRNA synthetase
MEDTDLERSSSLFVDAIVEDLSWLGISWEGEPLFQSSRFSLYREKALELWSKGWLYPCFCNTHDLERHRQECLKKGKPPRYSGKCRSVSLLEAQARIAEGEPYSLRLRVDPKVRIEWRDIVKGRKRFRGKDLDDILLLRSDGTPTYHLAVVVDDGEMGITHVIRGEDHMANTPYHILLFDALGYSVPLFAHVPLVKAPTGEVLEKREDSPWTLKSLREEGYLPLAVVNFLITLGWNPPHKPPLSCEEILEDFSLEEVSSSSVTFSPATLVFINKKLLSALPLENVLRALRPFLSSGLRDNRLREAVAQVRENASTLVELAQWVERLMVGPGQVELMEDEKAVLGRFVVLKREDISWQDILEQLASSLSRCEKQIFYQALRKALLGVPHGPPLKEVIEFLGVEVDVRLRRVCS